MRALRIVLRAVFDSAHLARSRYAPRTKFRLLFEYWRLTIKLLLVDPLVSLRRERLLGFRVEAFNYESLHFLFREIFVRSQYWCECPTDRPLIFDCGANIGLATLFFKWRYPHSTIHCFEPDRRTFEMLRRNVTANALTNVQLHNVALANSSGTTEFFIDGRHAGSLLMSMDPQRISGPDVEKTYVNSAKLSALVNGRHVDLVKLDVEGAEQLVMKDLVESGAIRMVKQLVVEYHHNVDHRNASLGDFLRLLESTGFKYQVDAAWTEPRDEFQDVLLYAYRLESPALL